MRPFLLIALQVSLACGSYPVLQLSPEALPFGSVQSRFEGRLSAIKTRLPAALAPTHYDLGIIPYINASDVENYLKAIGRVVITVTCLENTNSITLHAVEIDINRNRISVTHDGEEIQVVDLILNPNEETVTITLERELGAGNVYDVEIFFTARVADDRRNGLYLSRYVDPITGHVNEHVATQFEAIDARKAFPCFDEPALKATFTIRVGRQESHAALCNTGVESVVPIPPDYFYDVCHVTPVPMSTYLVAIVVVSGFTSHSHDSSLYPKPVTVWGPEEIMARSDATFSTDTLAKTLTFFENYMNHEYDFPKMESVAVGQFDYGAMENWGLNIYRLQDLFYQPADMTTFQKWRIAYVILHEISHQWFGNVVTMNWWTDIWLNEGLANYLQFVAAADVNPDFGPSDRFTIDASQSAMEFDGKPDAVPVHGDNETHFVDAPFEAVYQKGSALLRMMSGFLTPTTLQRGLQRYLQDTLYGNAHQDDLFNALTAQAAEDGISLPFQLTMKDVMDSWTVQSGFPLVRVSRVSKTWIFISQERFQNDPNHNLDPHTWYVPIAYVTKANPVPTPENVLPKTWMMVNELLSSHQVENADEWILVNPDATGFYRVLYDERLTQLLIRQLDADHTQISVLSRAQLIDDYFKCAFGEYISIKQAFDFTSFLDEERELPVWVTVFKSLRRIHELLSEDDEVGVKFREYLLSKLSPAFEFVGASHLPEDTPVTRMLREQLLDWACALGHPLCASTAAELVTAWMNSEDGENPILPDYQPMMYCAAVSSGGEAYRDFFLQKYTEVNPTSERQRTLLLNAVSCSTTTPLLTEALNMALDVGSGIRLEDAATLMGHVAENRDGRDVALAFITTQVDRILSSRVGEEGIQAVITSIAKYFATTERKDQVRNYLEANRNKFTAELVEAIEDKIGEIDANQRWIEVHLPGLIQFFPTLNA